MIENGKKALETINRLSNWLGIPPEALTNSRIKVSGAIEDGELIWYEARHDGTCWELIHETECTYLAAECMHPMEEFIHLEEPAVQWLSNFVAANMKKKLVRILAPVRMNVFCRVMIKIVPPVTVLGRRRHLLIVGRICFVCK